MKKIIGLLVIAAVIIGVWAYKKHSNTTVQASGKPVVKIGVIFPLSGDAGHMGEAAKVGIKMFEEELKSFDTKYDYKISIEDNQFNATKSVMVAKKMIEVDKVDAIFTIGSNIGNAISPLTQKSKILHFAISSDENVSQGEYNFLAVTPNNKMVEKLISELKNREIANIALVTQNQAAMLAWDKEFMAVNKDINVLSHNYINTGDRDFRILIFKILADKPDAVIPLVYIPEILIFTKQLKDAKPGVTLAGLESFSYPEDKRLFNGHWFIDGALPNDEFVEKFESIKGDDGYYYTPYMYASLEVLRNAFEKLGGNKEEIIEYIVNNDFDTVLGKIDFNESGIMQTSAVVKMIKDGKPVIIEE